MVINDVAAVIAGVAVLMGVFTLIMMMFVNRIDSELKVCITRLDAHIIAINQRTDELQKAMMDLIQNTRGDKNV